VGKVHLFDQIYKLYATDWGSLMVTLSFSEAIMAGLEQERATVCELNNLRLYKIAQGLLWVGEGKALGEVARLLGVSAKTVWNWLKRLMVQGLGWLVGQHYRGRGRKAKLSSEQKQALYALVVSGPQANGFDCGVWTSAMLVELIWRRWGVLQPALPQHSVSEAGGELPKSALCQ